MKTSENESTIVKRDTTKESAVNKPWAFQARTNDFIAEIVQEEQAELDQTKTPEDQLEEEARHPDANRHMYSPEIAKWINVKQPDIAAATVLYNLSLWQRNNYHQTMQDGRRYSFRSLSELHEDHPYLSKSAIKKALERLEKRLGTEFLVDRSKSKQWYSIGSKTLKRQKEGKLFSFSPEVAVTLEDIRAAVVFNNILYALSTFDRPKTDSSGNRYAKVSITKLADILQYSEDTISRILDKLVNKHFLLSKHPESSEYFCLSNGLTIQTGEVKSSKANVHTQTAEVHSIPADVHSNTAEVHNSPGTYSNEYRSESGTESRKCYIEPSMASPARFDSDLDLSSSALTNLVNMASEYSASKSSRTSVAQSSFEAVNNDATFPNKTIQPNASDLCCELTFVEPLDYYSVFTNREYSRQEWADAEIQDMKERWMMASFPYDDEDIMEIRKFQKCNPDLPFFTLGRLFNEMVTCDGVTVGKRDYSKDFDPLFYCHKTKTAKAFLKNLPKIVFQLFMDMPDQEGEFRFIEDTPYPFNEIDYSYLGYIPKTRFLPSFFHPFPTVEVDHERCPVI